MNINETLPQTNGCSSDVIRAKRSRWSSDEDARLIQLVEVYGPKNWDFIADKMKTRNDKGCRSRWFNYLAPRAKTGAVTAEEEQLIIDKQRQFGNCWSEIAKFLPGRSGVEIKKYWNGHLKHKLAMQQSSQKIEGRTNAKGLERKDPEAKGCALGSSEVISYYVEKQPDLEDSTAASHPLKCSTTDISSLYQLQNLEILQNSKTLPFVISLSATLIEMCDNKDPQTLRNVLEIADQICKINKSGQSHDAAAGGSDRT